MSKKNIHLLPDSPYSNWFVENCLELNLGLKNEFFCISEKVKYNDETKINTIAVKSNDLKSIVDSLNTVNNTSNLYIHYLDIEKAQVVNSITNPLINILWIVWSEDLYRLPLLKFNKYDTYSKNYLSTLNNNNCKRPKITFKQWLGRQKMIYIDRIDLTPKDDWYYIYKAIARINFAVTTINEEINCIKQNINKSIKPLKFTYISATNGLDIKDINYIQKEYIQIGNSADPSNNHFEIFKKIYDLKIEDKLLVQLSYGNKAYSEKLLNDISKFISSNKLIIQNEFVSKDEYYNKLKQVKSAVFAHNIHQGFGNIIALLVFGAKVFLKKNNPLFTQFKKWEVKIFSIEDDLTFDNLTIPLDNISVKRNQEIIYSLYSIDSVNQYYKNLLSI